MGRLIMIGMIEGILSLLLKILYVQLALSCIGEGWALEFLIYASQSLRRFEFSFTCATYICHFRRG
jgi:hypothetical protein